MALTELWQTAFQCGACGKRFAIRLRVIEVPDKPPTAPVNSDLKHCPLCGEKA